MSEATMLRMREESVTTTEPDVLTAWGSPVYGWYVIGRPARRVAHYDDPELGALGAIARYRKERDGENDPQTAQQTDEKECEKR